MVVHLWSGVGGGQAAPHGRPLKLNGTSTLAVPSLRPPVMTFVNVLY